MRTFLLICVIFTSAVMAKKVNQTKAEKTKEILDDAKNQAIKKLTTPKPIEQLISEEVFEDVCYTENKYCIVLIVPKIDDCNKDCRNKYLDGYKEVATVFNLDGWGYLWTVSEDHKDFERAFSIKNYGLPKVVVIVAKKKIYYQFRGPYLTSNLYPFFSEIRHHMLPPMIMNGDVLPDFSDVPVWISKSSLKEEL